MENGILRIATAGSVDNGKSTLIGRLLYDSKSIFEDQLSAAEKVSLRKGKSFLDLSLFTDGLREEVEEGITIDVAYRYFSTPNRKFILADTPGHFEFTRNMITGASTANAVIILMDATQGITDQTKRHSFIAGLLRIQHVIVCVNKMDLLHWDESAYASIREEYQSFVSRFNLKNVVFVPISALMGDNVVEKSKEMKWYTETSLLEILESLPREEIIPETARRCVVQCRLGELDGSFYYGVKMIQGTWKMNEVMHLFPTQKSIRASEMCVGTRHVEQLLTGTAGTVKLDSDALKRGGVLISGTILPSYHPEISATICWLSSESFSPEKQILIAHISGEYAVKQLVIRSVMDIQSLQERSDVHALDTNDMAKITFLLDQPMPFEPYSVNKEMGSFIVIDIATNTTVAAGMIE